MNDSYKNAKIYRLVSKNSNKVYIGSTVQPLSKRFIQHRCSYNSYANPLALIHVYAYQTSYEVFKDGDVSIELVEDFVCSNKNELDARENYHIIQNVNSVNKRGRSGFSSTENLAVYMKEYNKNNAYVCSCGSKVKSGKTKHNRSKKHKRFLESIGEESEHVKKLMKIISNKEIELEILKDKLKEINLVHI